MNLMFQERFAAAVASGEKLQTIRPRRKRPLLIGDKLSLRKWAGKAYRSKQVVLASAVVSNTKEIEIHDYGVFLNGEPLHSWQLKELAHADGFASWSAMNLWFSEAHGLPFSGTLILWELTDA